MHSAGKSSVHATTCVNSKSQAAEVSHLQPALGMQSGNYANQCECSPRRGREASSPKAASLELTSSPVRRSAGDAGRDDEDSVAPSPAEEHPRSHRLQRSDSLDSLASLVRRASPLRTLRSEMR